MISNSKRRLLIFHNITAPGGPKLRKGEVMWSARLNVYNLR